MMDESQFDQQSQQERLNELPLNRFLIYFNATAAFDRSSTPFPPGGVLRISEYHPTTQTLKGDVNLGSGPVLIEGTLTELGLFRAPRITLTSTDASQPFQFVGWLLAPPNPTGDKDPKHQMFIAGQFSHTRLSGRAFGIQVGPTPFCAFGGEPDPVP
jgi:hypothetical protein